MTQTLRPYQDQAVSRVLAAWQTRLRVLLVAPTGAGKSSIIADLIAKEPGRVVAIAHRRELIDQLADRIGRNHGIDCGIIMAGHPKQDRRVQVASVQTLVRRVMPPADLVIIDESHHAKATTYEKILAFYPEARVLGATATPIRLDGKGLGDLFEEMVIAATPQELIDQGFLVGTTGFAYLSPDLSEIKTTAGDYDQGGLSLAYQKSKVLGDIVEQWHKHCAGKRTIVFASSIANSKQLVATWGVPAEHLDHETPRAERDAIVARVRSGETLVVSNVGILGEGVDFPDLEVAILARPTKSLGFFLQMVGRVLRPASGKVKARLHDHAGLLAAHGFPEIDRHWQLTTTRRKEPVPGVKTCPMCGCVNAASEPECTECGYVWEAHARKPQEPDTAHVALALDELRELMARRNDRDALFRSFMEEARATGRRPGWAVYRLKDKIPGCAFPASIWREMVVGVKGNWSFRE